jgi:hypothetical protein
MLDYAARGPVPSREHLVQRPHMICARIWGMRLSACKTRINLYETKCKDKAAFAPRVVGLPLALPSPRDPPGVRLRRPAGRAGVVLRKALA